MSDLPGWLRAGAEVAVLTQHRHNRHDVVKLTTIERVGKRDVVLANGERFNVNDYWIGEDHIQRRARDHWSPSTLLYSVEHPRVKEARALSARMAAQEKIQGMLSAWVRSGDPTEIVLIEQVLKKFKPRP